MNTKIVATALFCFIGFGFTACTKTDDTPQSAQTRAELLLGRWSISGMMYSPAYDQNGDGITENDAFPVLRPCEKDNIVTFKPNGIQEYDEGPSKCNPTDPQSVPGTWGLNNNDTFLAIDADLWTIIVLNTTTLKISLAFVEAGITYTVTITYTRL